MWWKLTDNAVYCLAELRLEPGKWQKFAENHLKSGGLTVLRGGQQHFGLRKFSVIALTLLRTGNRRKVIQQNRTFTILMATVASPFSGMANW